MTVQHSAITTAAAAASNCTISTTICCCLSEALLPQQALLTAVASCCCCCCCWAASTATLCSVICASNRSRCSRGSVSSGKALASSRPAARRNSSKGRQAQTKMLAFHAAVALLQEAEVKSTALLAGHLQDTQHGDEEGSWTCPASLHCSEIQQQHLSTALAASSRH